MLSKKIKSLIAKFREQEIPFHANDNISKHLTSSDIKHIEQQVERHFDLVLRSLLIDVDTDHNCKDTAKRYAKMLVRETMSGRYTEPPSVTSFPNAKNLDELIVVGPLKVESMCSHHLQNIRGWCYIGVLPTSESHVPGLSKYSRRLQYFCKRPQIQEELTCQIADDIADMVKDNDGIGVIIIAEHQCMSCRGVQEPNAYTTTSVMRGSMRDSSLKGEFLKVVEMNKHMAGM